MKIINSELQEAMVESEFNLGVTLMKLTRSSLEFKILALVSHSKPR